MISVLFTFLSDSGGMLDKFLDLSPFPSVTALICSLLCVFMYPLEFHEEDEAIFRGKSDAFGSRYNRTFTFVSISAFVYFDVQDGMEPIQGPNCRIRYPKVVQLNMLIPVPGRKINTSPYWKQRVRRSDQIRALCMDSFPSEDGAFCRSVTSQFT